MTFEVADLCSKNKKEILNYFLWSGEKRGFVSPKRINLKGKMDFKSLNRVFLKTT